MKRAKAIGGSGNEAGIALLISIFVLLLISVVAIALIVSSGTETSLAGNYRSSTSVYYAALSGIEEARGRLSYNDPNAFRITWTGANGWASFYPPGSTFPIGTAAYILNPGPTETAATLLTTYPDTEYLSEFGSNPSTVKTTLSIWNNNPLNSLSFPGPQYKWVRINAVSEKSLNLADTYPFVDGSQDTTPLYYDGTHITDNTSSGRQVFEITALAVLPNASGQNSQKLVQYLAAPAPVQLPAVLGFAPPAALTLSGSPGNSPTFQAPLNNAFYAIKGDGWDCSGNPTASHVPAIGLIGDYSGNSYAPDITGIIGGIPTNASGTNTQPNYTGNTPPHSLPDVEYLTSFPANLQSPAQVDAIAQNIIQSADAAFVPAGSNATQIAFLTSLGMSSSNPMTVIARGDLDISGWSHDGYGLLLVTGTFTYDPDTNWYGTILVIGKGQVNGSHQQYRQINGAVFVARTRDASGVLLSGRIGGASVSFNSNMQGNGIRYSSCLVQAAQPYTAFKVLSFHEIAQ